VYARGDGKVVNGLGGLGVDMLLRVKEHMEMTQL